MSQFRLTKGRDAHVGATSFVRLVYRADREDRSRNIGATDDDSSLFEKKTNTRSRFWTSQRDDRTGRSLWSVPEGTWHGKSVIRNNNWTFNWKTLWGFQLISSCILLRDAYIVSRSLPPCFFYPRANVPRLPDIPVLPLLPVSSRRTSASKSDSNRFKARRAFAESPSDFAKLSARVCWPLGALGSPLFCLQTL